MKDGHAAASAVRQRSRGFRIGTGIAQVVLGFAAGYLINWGTLLGTLDVQVAAGWALPWLIDIWLVPVAVTSSLVAALWVTRPKIRIALASAAMSSLITTAFFVWIGATW